MPVRVLTWWGAGLVAEFFFGGGVIVGRDFLVTRPWQGFVCAHVPTRLAIAVRITALSDVVAVVASRPDMVIDDVTPIASAVVGLNVVGTELGAGMVGTEVGAEVGA